MEKQKIADIINGLNRLLTEDMSLHTVSFKFDQLAQDIRILGLSFKTYITLEYILDPRINYLHHEEKKLMSEGLLLEAIEVREKKRQMIEVKGINDTTILRYEPSYFTATNIVIVAYLSKRIVKERLLLNLIEGYGLRKST